MCIRDSYLSVHTTEGASEKQSSLKARLWNRLTYLLNSVINILYNSIFLQHKNIPRQWKLPYATNFFDASGSFFRQSPWDFTQGAVPHSLTSVRTVGYHTNICALSHPKRKERKEKRKWRHHLYNVFQKIGTLCYFITSLRWWLWIA